MRLFSSPRLRNALLLLTLAFAPVAGWADGTVTTADLLKSLAPTNPKLIKVLQDGYDLDKDAEGDVIGNAINRNLGGTRIGPYTVHARPKGSSGPMDLIITLNTDTVFLDRAGKPTNKPALATRVKEQLKSFEVSTAP